MRKHRAPETVRMLRIPHPSELPTDEIPRYDEEGDVRHNDGEDPRDDFIERRPGGFKDRQIQYMTAAVIWFMLACILGVLGAAVLKIMSAILG